MAKNLTKPKGRPARGGPTVRALRIMLKAELNARFERVCVAYDAKNPTIGENPSVMARLLFTKGLETLEKEFGLQPELPNLEMTTTKSKK